MAYDYTPTLKHWLAQVEEHYGSLENFSDAGTIRIQLANAEKTIAENDEFLAAVSDIDINTQSWEDDLVFLRDLKERLTKWLHDRSLSTSRFGY